jgi:hypothetical protein
MTVGNTEIQPEASPETAKEATLLVKSARSGQIRFVGEKVKEAPEGYRKIPPPPDKIRT